MSSPFLSFIAFKWFLKRAQRNNIPNHNPQTIRSEINDILIFKCNPKKEVECHQVLERKNNKNIVTDPDVAMEKHIVFDFNNQIIKITKKMTVTCFYTAVKTKFMIPDFMCFYFPLDFKEDALYSINKWTILNIHKIQSSEQILSPNK